MTVGEQVGGVGVEVIEKGEERAVLMLGEPVEELAVDRVGILGILAFARRQCRTAPKVVAESDGFVRKWQEHAPPQCRDLECPCKGEHVVVVMCKAPAQAGLGAAKDGVGDETRRGVASLGQELRQRGVARPAVGYIRRTARGPSDQ